MTGGLGPHAAVPPQNSRGCAAPLGTAEGRVRGRGRRRGRGRGELAAWARSPNCRPAPPAGAPRPARAGGHRAAPRERECHSNRGHRRPDVQPPPLGCPLPRLLSTGPAVVPVAAAAAPAVPPTSRGAVAPPAAAATCTPQKRGGTAAVWSGGCRRASCGAAGPAAARRHWPTRKRAEAPLAGRARDAAGGGGTGVARAAADGPAGRHAPGNKTAAVQVRGPLQHEWQRRHGLWGCHSCYRAHRPRNAGPALQSLPRWSTAAAAAGWEAVVVSWGGWGPADPVGPPREGQHRREGGGGLRRTRLASVVVDTHLRA